MVVEMALTGLILGYTSTVVVLAHFVLLLILAG